MSNGAIACSCSEDVVLMLEFRAVCSHSVASHHANRACIVSRAAILCSAYLDVDLPIGRAPRVRGCIEGDQSAPKLCNSCFCLVELQSLRRTLVLGGLRLLHHDICRVVVLA
jgi:hypothetical protein